MSEVWLAEYDDVGERGLIAVCATRDKAREVCQKEDDLEHDGPSVPLEWKQRGWDENDEREFAHGHRSCTYYISPEPVIA